MNSLLIILTVMQNYYCFLNVVNKIAYYNIFVNKYAFIVGS